MAPSLRDCHAFITGAGSGIGSAIARALVGAGARVSMAGRRAEPLAHLAGELGSHLAADFAGVDVTDPAAIAGGVAAARGRFGPIDILINNAGQAPSASFAGTSLALWSQVLAVDLTSVFAVTQAVLPDLQARGSGARIINIASTAGLTGYAYVSAYCAAKHGVIGLTRALAAELAASGITVNAVCPGFTDTALIREAAARIEHKTGRKAAEVLAGFARTNPQGRLVTPAEVADTVVWLASPGASAINGQAIVVAGGEIMAG